MSSDQVSTILSSFPGSPSDLIPILQKVQENFGFLPQGAIRSISRRLKISENEIYGVATFYAQFRFHPPGKHHIRVCLGTACHVKGGEQILDALQRKLEIEPGQTTEDGEYDMERVACLGCCALAPVMTIDEKTHASMSVLKLQRILDEQENA